MKRKLLLSAMGIAGVSALMAQNPGSMTSLGPGTVANAVSPGGEFVVGYSVDAENEYAGTGAFVYNTRAETLEWLEQYNAEDPTSGAIFNHITDSGIIAGASKHPELTYKYVNTDDSKEYTDHLNVATIWKDGKKILLGIGDYSPSDFAYFGNGSYAISCNEDATLINGYIIKGGTYAKQPCRWYLNAETGEYDYEALVLPRSADYFAVDTAMASADGTFFVMEAKLDGMLGYRGFVMYDEFGAATVFDPYEANRNTVAYIYDISPSGKYALFFSYNLGWVPQIGLYDLKEMKVEWIIPLPENVEVLNCTGLAVDDNGRGYIASDNGVLYFSRPEDLCIPVMNYFKSFEEGITDLPSNFANNTIYEVNADGSTILGNSGEYADGTLEAWVMLLPKEQPVNLNAVGGLEAYYSAPDEVVVRWKPLVVTEGITLTGYYIDFIGEHTTVAIDELTADSDGKYRYTQHVDPGYTVRCTVRALATANGKNYESAPSSVEVSMSANTSPWMYDDFDDCGISGDGLTVYYIGDDWFPCPTSDVYAMEWHLNYRDYTNNTPYFVCQSTSDVPWHSRMVSRFFDATNVADDMYFTYYLQKKSVNSTPELAADRLDLQWSEDGFNWTTLVSYNSADYAKNNWNFYRIDLNELRGKRFQLRWNAYGDGNAYLEWRLDYMGVVKDAKTPGPAGLRKMENADGGIDLEWAINTGAYEFSYLANHPVVAEQSVGNAGKPLMIGIKLDGADVAKYSGMQIKTISSLIWDNPEKQNHATTMEGVVFKDGKEVARVRFDAPEDITAIDFGPSMAILDKPVDIKAGSTYIIAVNIENYADNAAPIWYQVREDACVPGKSDLFSEDGGQTWEWLSEQYVSEQDMEIYGWAIWPIRVGIQAPDSVLDEFEHEPMLWGYNVYRDGERINDRCLYYAAPHFHDAEGSMANEYTVEAFYTDGRVSVMSSKAISGVQELESPVEADITVADGIISVSGQATWAEVYNLAGMKVAASSGILTFRNLPKGVYLVVAGNAGFETKTAKVMVK